MTTHPRKPMLTGRLVVFLAATAIAEAAYTMTLVQVPVYLRELGAGIPQVGLFFTLAMIFPLFLRIPGGWLSDSIGRLRSLFIACLAGVLGYLPYVFAPTWEFALLGPAVHAVTAALRYPSYKAYIAEHTDDDTRGRVFGLSQGIIMLAWIVGPPVGGYLAQNLGFRTMFAAAAVTYALAGVIFAGLGSVRAAPDRPSEHRPSWSSWRASVANMVVLIGAGGIITWLLVSDGSREIATRLSFDLMPVYLREVAGISVQSIGLLDGIFGIAATLAAYPAGWLVDRTGERVVILLGLFTLANSFLAFGVVVGFWGFAFAWVLLGVGNALLDPAYSSIIARAVPRRLQGITYGVWITMLGLVALPFPWLGSQLWVGLGPRAPFLITGAAGMLALIPALKLTFRAVDERTPTRLRKLAAVPSATDVVPYSTPAPATSAGPPTLGQKVPPSAEAPAVSQGTVLFVGLRDRQDRQHDPDERLAIMRLFFSSVLPILASHQGVTSILDPATASATFGIAPQPLPTHVSALLAAHAAVEVLELTRQLNRRRAAHDLPPLEIAIGISTGTIAARGDPGIPSGSDGPGEAVEAAGDLQRYAMTLDGPHLLVGESVYRSLAGTRDQFNFGSQTTVRMMSPGGESIAYELLGRLTSLLDPDDVDSKG